MVNLLPERNKNIIIREKKYRTLLFLFVYLLVFLFSFSGTLYALSVFSAHLAKSEKESLLIKKANFPDIQKREEEINQVNKALSEINSFYENAPRVFMVVEKIYVLFPENAHLRTFRFTEGGKITLTGYAVGWEELEKIEQNLSDYFENVEFSPGVWAQVEDINFTVTFEL